MRLCSNNYEKYQTHREKLNRETKEGTRVPQDSSCERDPKKVVARQPISFTILKNQ